MKTLQIDIVAAIAANSVIGANNALPFKLSTDLKRFKALTLGKPVILGRKTFQSIGRPLPGRANIVISRQPEYSIEGALSAHSLEEGIRLGLDAARAAGVDTICIIGGGEIYRQALMFADRLLITHVEADVDGDTYFPYINAEVFEAGPAEFVPKSEKDSHSSRYIVYQRRKGA